MGNYQEALDSKILSELRRTNDLLVLQCKLLIASINHEVDCTEYAMKLDKLQEQKSDPRHVPPAANVEVFREDNRQKGPSWLC